MDPNKRIEQLEAQVKRLAEQVEALRMGRVTTDQGSAALGTAGSGPGFNRVLLLSMTVALALGAAVTFSIQRLTLQQVVGLDRDLATVDLEYPLLIAAILTASALLFYVIRRWRMFTWLAMIATYLTYATCFFRQPAALPIREETYFWVANGCLSLCYLLFSVACILALRGAGSSRRRTALAALVNSGLYLALVWMPIRQQFPEQEGWFRLGFASDPVANFGAKVLAVPEPTTAGLLVLGGLLAVRRKRR